MQISKQLLKEVQYKDSHGYDDRMAPVKFATEPFDHWQWQADHYDFSSVRDILEVGCGPGVFWQYVKSKLSSNQHLTLTDFSQDMLEIAKQKISTLDLPCDVEFDIADVENLSYSNNKFDLVIAHFMLYHAQSQGQALEEIKRVLKPNGWAGISTIRLSSYKEFFILAHEIDSRIPLESPVLAPFAEAVADQMLPKFFPQIKKYVAEKVLAITESKYVVNFFKTHPVAQYLQLKDEFFAELERRVTNILAQEKKFVFEYAMALYFCSKKTAGTRAKV